MPPYRKRYAKRSYGRSRSTSRRRRPMGGTFMKRARTRAYANLRTGGLLAIERKFSDLAYPNTLLGNGVGGAVVSGGDSTFAPPVLAPTQYRSAIGKIFTVAPTALNVLVVGESGCDRDGRQVINDSIHIRGQVESRTNNDFGAANCAFTVNIVLVLDTQTNGAQLNSEDVFKNTGAADALNADPVKNLLFGSRFRILKSQVYDLTPPGAMVASANYASNGVRRDFDWYIPFKGGLPVNLNAGTTADVANVIDNSLHVVAFATLASSVIGYNARIRFQG